MDDLLKSFWSKSGKKNAGGICLSVAKANLPRPDPHSSGRFSRSIWS